MSIEASRWKYTWFLLSLDRVTQLWPELWIRTRDPVALHAKLQQILRPYLSGERFYHEAQRMSVDVLQAVEASFGIETVTALRNWCTYVLVDGGSDRAQEFFWSSLCAKLANGGGDLPPPLRERCHAVTMNMQRRRAVLKAKLETARQTPLSPWDQQIVALSHGTAEDADTAIAGIVKLNAFAEAWKEECVDLSSEQLVAMREAVEQVRTELDMADVEIGIPGIWLYELADSIAPITR